MSDRTIKLIILGDPKTQQRHRSHYNQPKKGGKGFISQYDPSKTEKRDILRVVQTSAPDQPFRCPLRVDLYLYYPRPKSHYRTGQYAHLLKDSAPKWHTSTPDRDNADKIILDALSGVFWKNDSIVCDGRISKRYSEKPRTVIFITPLEKDTIFP